MLLLRSNRLWKLVILAPAVAAMVANLRSPLHGAFYFRQAHVMANVEKFLAHGLSLKPETFNFDVPFFLFDFPLFQWVVAAFSALSHLDPLVAARLVALFVFLATFLSLDSLLAYAGIGHVHRLLTLLFFVYAPLDLFYFESPMVDDLAILLSFVSLSGFLRWQDAEGGKRWIYFALMTGSGVLSTLIKNPVYLPVFIAIGATVVHRNGWRAVRQPGALSPPAARGGAPAIHLGGVLLYVAAILASVIGFKLYANAVNGISGFLAGTESQDYFGPLADRLDLRSWKRIVTVMATETSSPVVILLSVVGTLFYGAHSRGRHRALFLGLLAGSFAALLVFFNRYTWHDYYQLPFVFPLAFFAAYAVEELVTRARGAGRARPRLALGLSLAAAVLAPLWDLVGFRTLSQTPTDFILSRGRWITSETRSDDFILYLLDTDDATDWNPVFLYVARRDGYNVTRARFMRHPDVLVKISSRYAKGYKRILVFCPPELVWPLADRLQAPELALVAASVEGRLYARDTMVRIAGPTSARNR